MKIVEDAALDQKVQALLDRIPQEVDKMIGQLKSSLINPMTRPQARRGIWDRFKNTMSNLWWGRYNQDNPYFWNNKLGDDLGQVHPEHVMLRTIPIEEYRLFRNHCQLLEDRLEQLFEDTIPGTENLAIMRTIDQWGNQLKALLTKTVKDHIYGAGVSPVVPDATEAPDVPDAPVSGPKPVDPKQKILRDRQKFMVQSAHQLRDDGKISEEEFKQLIDAAQEGQDVEMGKFQKGWELLKQLSRRDTTATGSEIADSKQKLRDRLDALGGLIEDEAYDKIKKHIDEDDLDKAEEELARYESENPEPRVDEVETKRTSAMDALEKAKERGLPEDKYEAYKKAISGATDPTTLDRVIADLNRTATIDSHGESGSELPPDVDETEDETEEVPSEPGPTYSSYWDKRPNTGDREWDNLSPSEKAAWNNYGGGVQRRIAKKGLKGLVIPWILRIGDPRTDILYNRDRRHIWNELRNQERIELDTDQVESRQDFERRLENAKKLRQQYVDKLSRRGRKSDVDIEREKLAGDAGTVPPTDHEESPAPTPGRTTEMPSDSLPPNMPEEKGESDKEDRTHILDDDLGPKDALDHIAKAKEEGIISDDEVDALTDLVMDDKIKLAMKKLFRMIAAKEEAGDDVETFDWIAPRSILREKVEYYKKLLREGTKCVR